MSRIPEDIIVRYETMLSDVEARIEEDPGTSIAHAKWMLTELRKDKEWGKHNRWLGNIQLNLILNGYTTTKAERDFTRPYFTKETKWYYILTPSFWMNFFFRQK